MCVFVFVCGGGKASCWLAASRQTDERSCTSFHKDHYENIFVVIAGEKEFHLLPPHEGFRLSSRTYRAATFKATEDRGAYEIRPDPDGAEVNWSSLDLDMQEEHQEEHFPHFASRSWPTPITCKVKEGDIMYLPPIWWHYVRQTVDKENRCIAVNFWYDMQFGPTTIASMFSDVLSKSLSPGWVFAASRHNHNANMQNRGQRKLLGCIDVVKNSGLPHGSKNLESCVQERQEARHGVAEKWRSEVSWQRFRVCHSSGRKILGFRETGRYQVLYLKPKPGSSWSRWVHTKLTSISSTTQWWASVNTFRCKTNKQNCLFYLLLRQEQSKSSRKYRSEIFSDKKRLISG